jgi:hypothetical protein
MQSRIEKLEIGKNTARFTGAAFALLGYYVLYPSWLPTPSNNFLQWAVPVIAGCFAGFYAIQAVKNYQSELRDFLKQNLTIAGAIVLLVLSTTLLWVSEKAFEASAAQPIIQPGLAQKRTSRLIQTLKFCFRENRSSAMCRWHHVTSDRFPEGNQHDRWAAQCHDLHFTDQNLYGWFQ